MVRKKPLMLERVDYLKYYYNTWNPVEVREFNLTVCYYCTRGLRGTNTFDGDFWQNSRSNMHTHTHVCFGMRDCLNVISLFNFEGYFDAHMILSYSPFTLLYLLLNAWNLQIRLRVCESEWATAQIFNLPFYYTSLFLKKISYLTRTQHLLLLSKEASNSFFQLSAKITIPKM